MKNTQLILCLFISTLIFQVHAEVSSINNEPATVNTMSRKFSEKLISKGFVLYSDFGAVGDGKTDDIKSIVAAHDFANKHKLEVKADAEATYYIGGRHLAAIIQTNTDFGTAHFIIDDTEVENREASIFEVISDYKPINIKGVASLKQNQEKINATLPSACLLLVTDETCKQYIRFGLNQNNGFSKTDVIIVDKEGRVNMKSPIIWDFDRISEIVAMPIDETILKISGGCFTTIANKAKSKYTYYSRNIMIRRSNVIVDGLEHRITGEGEQGAPYRGFITVTKCTEVEVRNTLLTGHKMYRTIGSAGRSVTMGSYDISVNRALNVSFVNCIQTNDINDNTYWGIMASNYCKNLVYDGCTLSRFDAHMGVYNATIRNSTLGYMGIKAIGKGYLLVENTTVHSRNFISLRQDYGSTWEGEFIIRDCTFVPRGEKLTTVNLIGGFNSGLHDFGYRCYMPEKISIDKLHIDDANHSNDYNGACVFANFNPKMKDESYKESFPYIRTKSIILSNITSSSGKALRISDNNYPFKDLKVVRDKAYMKTNFPKEVVFVDSLPNPDDLYIFFMAGQSNMAGRAFVEPSDTLLDKRILTIDKDFNWVYAKEPLHFYEPSLSGLDCGVAFAQTLLESLPQGASVAMIPCAVGGSSIEQWLNNETFRQVALLDNFKHNVDITKDYGQIKGVLWHQGESNAKPELIKTYGHKLDSLFYIFRQVTQDETLPIIIGELGSFAQTKIKQALWSDINTIIRDQGQKANISVISTQDLNHIGDRLHFDSDAQRQMGRRMAQTYTNTYYNKHY